VGSLADRCLRLEVGLVGWSEIERVLSEVPASVWVAVVVANAGALATTWSAARRRIRHAGGRAGAALGAESGRGRDAALTVATLLPALFFFVMVLAGSFHGLVAFGYHTLGWRGGWELLVPATLDGVSLAFAMLAFRAVRRGRPPDRCYRVVWAAAVASATINFGYEYGQSGNMLAGGYVGLLSLFAMVMFDELLSQFEQGARTLRRENPKFGWRWVTWPTNTFLAAVAWRNHPPAEGTPGTVLNAVENLQRVRSLKRDARTGRGNHRSATGRQLLQPSREAVAEDEPQTHDGRAWPSRPSRTPNGPRANGEVRMPTTAATVRQWLRIWVVLCADPSLAASPLTDDEYARATFGVRARQLRNIRFAAGTGALRRRAEELGVALPEGYVDQAIPRQ
jgi:hypothetical protein